MNKLTFMAFIIGFWIFMPLTFSILGVDGFPSITFDGNMNIFTYAGKMVSFFFSFMVLDIPDGLNPFIIAFFYLMTAATGVVVYLLIRGD